MSAINLISLMILAVILIVGISIHLWLKRRLRELDGVIGITNAEKVEQSN